MMGAASKKTFYYLKKNLFWISTEMSQKKPFIISKKTFYGWYLLVLLQQQPIFVSCVPGPGFLVFQQPDVSKKTFSATRGTGMQVSVHEKMCFFSQ